jgi:hypothetical protein
MLDMGRYVHIDTARLSNDDLKKAAQWVSSYKATGRSAVETVKVLFPLRCVAMGLKRDKVCSLRAVIRLINGRLLCERISDELLESGIFEAHKCVAPIGYIFERSNFLADGFSFYEAVYFTGHMQFYRHDAPPFVDIRNIRAGENVAEGYIYGASVPSPHPDFLSRSIDQISALFVYDQRELEDGERRMVERFRILLPTIRERFMGQ